MLCWCGLRQIDWISLSLTCLYYFFSGVCSNSSPNSLEFFFSDIFKSFFLLRQTCRLYDFDWLTFSAARRRCCYSVSQILFKKSKIVLWGEFNYIYQLCVLNWENNPSWETIYPLSNILIFRICCFYVSYNFSL